MPRRPFRLPAAILILGGLAGCMSSGSSGGSSEGSSFTNLLLFGGATRPPVAVNAPDEVDCPSVSVVEGGAAVRAGGGQLSIANLARECAGRPDGAIVVKVGVQGRALLGQNGGATRFDTPLTIVLKRGDQILDSRTRRVSVAIPPGQVDHPFVVVEEGLVAPPGAGEFDIEVGFGSGARPAAATRRRARG